jgi:hypothetical protein
MFCKDCKHYHQLPGSYYENINRDICRRTWTEQDTVTGQSYYIHLNAHKERKKQSLIDKIKCVERCGPEGQFFYPKQERIPDELDAGGNYV